MFGALGYNAPTGNRLRLDIGRGEMTDIDRPTTLRLGHHRSSLTLHRDPGSRHSLKSESPSVKGVDLNRRSGRSLNGLKPRVGESNLQALVGGERRTGSRSQQESRSFYPGLDLIQNIGLTDQNDILLVFGSVDGDS